MARITHTFHIDVPQGKVLEAISTVNGLQNWWTEKTSGGEQIGGVLEFRFGGGAFIDFQVVENNGVDSYGWKCRDAHPEWIGTEVSFKLSQNDGKTRVEFSHSNWQEQSSFFAQCNFSWGRYLSSLRDYCEEGKGNPYKD